ncbi:MAG: heavy metal translocating P-type ATPase [Thiohalospira sp.]
MPEPASTTDPEAGAEGATSGECFHCGLPVPVGADYRVTIDGAEQSMCCPGCQAVAQAIVDSGLTDYYRHRTAKARNAGELIPDALAELDLYDRESIQRSFVAVDEDDVREAALILEGITCAACVWLSERHVRGLDGVLDFQVNYATHRARVRWDASRIALSDILRAIAAIGYRAHPFDPGQQESLYKRERGAALRRLAVAGLGTMQVMMLAVALYAGHQYGMDAQMERFLRWVSLLLATPVVFYAGWPFFTSAWRDLKSRRAGMDVPVSLAVASTWGASAWATATGGGEVYFESATMFVFFLLTSRFLEMGVRHRAGQAVEAVGRLLPAAATRITAEGAEETVPVSDLAPGDRVRVRPGDPVPADGEVVSGHSATDESLLTGESQPVPRGEGDEVIGGSVNRDSPLEVAVRRVGPDTVVAGIQRLLDRAQSEKPAVARMAERGTGVFVLLILGLALVAGGAWTWAVDIATGFWVAVAVLVASCPCALALATPVAITASVGALTRLGLLTTRGHALDGLAGATRVLFDKTGTLTRGEPAVTETVAFRGSSDHARAVAAALEAGSSHPLGRALAAAGPAITPAVEALTNRPGLGVTGRVDGVEYWLGSPDFIRAESPGGRDTEALEAAVAANPAATPVALADADGVRALFLLADTLREDAAATIAALRARGLAVGIVSGDSPATVAAVAERLGIDDHRGGLDPAGKLAAVRDYQARGERVAVVGDGVNDAPVLAGADVSVAMARATELAHASADLILQGDRLPALAEAVDRARATHRVIRQNIAWALGYNLIALPVAAAGWLTPWLAALGMSLSSLIVVTNALRLSGGDGRQE